MPEQVLWSYIVQIASALKVIHSAGLAARVIEPSKILVTSKMRYVAGLMPETWDENDILTGILQNTIELLWYPRCDPPRHYSVSRDGAGRST